jgi:cell division protein FtsQ
MIHLRQHQAPYAAPIADTPNDVVWLQRGTWLCAIFLVCMVLFLLLRSFILAPWFSIQKLQLRGDTQFHNAMTIQANVVPQLSGNYFTLDVRRAQKTFEALPLIRSAIVQRVFPNQLQVQLTAHEPVAKWESFPAAKESTADADPEISPPDLERLVNRHGELFEASGGALDTDNLPVLAGPDARSAEILDTFKALNSLLQTHNMALKSLVIDPFSAWQATLDNDATVALGVGGSAEVLARAQRWLSHWPTLKRQYDSPMQSVDLRYQQGFSVRLSGVTTRTKAR